MSGDMTTFDDIQLRYQDHKGAVVTAELPKDKTKTGLIAGLLSSVLSSSTITRAKGSMIEGRGEADGDICIQLENNRIFRKDSANPTHPDKLVGKLAFHAALKALGWQEITK